jgi:hypothetical protein
METTEFANGTEPAQRPTFLKVLCILTFISAGLGCLMSLITPLIADMYINFLQNSPNYDEVKMADAIKLLQAGWEYYAPSFLLTLLSLSGAILMWKLKKIGFHLYAAANLALLFIPTLVVGIPISMVAIAITIIFISMYAVNFKHLS